MNWNSLKADLFDFVNTITEDTSKALIFDPEVNQETSNNLREQMLIDCRRSYNTYANPVDEINCKEYDKYLKNFSLAMYGNEIAKLLDDEPDVSRYYAELVPKELTPDEFWSRYFFKIMVMNRGSVVNLDDEYDDEDLAWEEPDVTVQNNSSRDNKEEIINNLKEENSLLKNQVKTLALRIADLESLIITLKGNISNVTGSYEDSEDNIVVLNGSDQDNSSSNILHTDNMMNNASSMSSLVSDDAKVDTESVNKPAVLLKEEERVALLQKLEEVVDDDEEQWS